MEVRFEIKNLTISGTLSLQPATTISSSSSLPAQAAQLEGAKEWLKRFLPLEAEQVFKGAKDAGFSRRTIYQAGRELGVVKHPEGGAKKERRERCWMWELPDESPNPQQSRSQNSPNTEKEIRSKEGA